MISPKPAKSILKAQSRFARLFVQASAYARHARGHAMPWHGLQVTAYNDSGAQLEKEAQVGAFNEAIVPDQEWFRVSPFGDFKVTINEAGVQKRVTQRIDRTAAEAMVAAYNSVAGRMARMFRGLPIFIGHADDAGWRKLNPGIPAEAMGRIKELQVRDDGLYGRHAFNDRGRPLVSGEAAAYDSHSPHWLMAKIAEGIFRPVELLSIGLTNLPNLPGTSIGLNEVTAPEISEPMKSNLIKLLAALGKTVAADATDEQLTAALNEALTVATTATAAVNEAATLKTQLTTAQNEVTTLQTQLTDQKTVASNERSARADVVLVSAINTGKITEAQRAEWKGKLVAASDFSAVASQIVALNPALNTSSSVDKLGNRKSEASVTLIAAVNEAVEKKKTATNCSHADAYIAVRKEKPELFKISAE